MASGVCICSMLAQYSCSRCRGTSYCSKSCQEHDWGIHKLTCSPADKRKPTTIRTIVTLIRSLRKTGYGPVKHLSFEDNVLLQPFELYLRKVEVKRSPYHGRGVFATQHIKKDEIITMYPCHVLRITHDPDIDGHVKTDVIASGLFQKRFPPSELEAEFLGDYAFVVDSRLEAVGHPKLDRDANYSGHLINDGAKLEEDGDEEAYIKASTELANCMFLHIEKSMVTVCATSNIQAGEEVLTTYSPEYWRSYHKRLVLPLSREV